MFWNVVIYVAPPCILWRYNFFFVLDIYRSWQGYGKFSAILATFLISSFLHGLEIKVSIVLVSLGLFSLIQVAARDKIAMIFDCCVRVRSCKDCNHKYKRSSIIVMAILILYSIFTIVHLAYLGVLMDSSTDEVGIFGKWQDLYFISHIIMCINVLLLLWIDIFLEIMIVILVLINFY